MLALVSLPNFPQILTRLQQLHLVELLLDYMQAQRPELNPAAKASGGPWHTTCWQMDRVPLTRLPTFAAMYRGNRSKPPGKGKGKGKGKVHATRNSRKSDSPAERKQDGAAITRQDTRIAMALQTKDPRNLLVSQPEVLPPHGLNALAALSYSTLVASDVDTYNDTIVDHYESPRNVGSLDKADPNVGTGLVGAPAHTNKANIHTTFGNESPYDRSLHSA